MKEVRYLLVVFLVGFTLSSFAQKDHTKEAEGAFIGEQYYAAIDLYKKAYSKESDRKKKIDIIYKIARCYHKINDYDQAEVWYDKSLKAQHPDPRVQLYLAEVIQEQGRYDEAIAEYNKYLAKNPGDPVALEGVKTCETAQEWEEEPTDFKVENVQLINSKAFDFSPMWADDRYDELVFTSTRAGSVGSDIDTRTGENFSDIYHTELDRKGKWSTPVAYDSPLNTPVNEGGVTFDDRYSYIYFTRCKTEKNEKLGCIIMSARKQGRGWAEPEKVKFGQDSLGFAADSFVVAHPAMLPDGETMIFVSDVPDGVGGKDLYITTYERRERMWTEPEILTGEVNTKGDEMFPYVSEAGDLYFASNGHRGMGGLDIFKAEKTGDKKWGNVENMKAPINSSYDDFGLIVEGKKEKGFFSSNRPGGRGGDDIYLYKKPPLIFAIQGTVTDVDTDEPLPGATVKLVGTDGTSVETQTDQTGFYIFDEKEGSGERYVKENTSYTLLVSKEGYLNSKGQETTVGVEKSTAFVHDFVLQCADCGEIEFSKVLYPLDKASLLVNSEVNSKDSLDVLYQILVDNPNIVIELQAHTDSRGDDEYNQELSQRRAQTCVEYLIEKGVDPERLVAKGYGENSPFHGPFNGERATLDEAYISNLPEDLQEEAHQANRRTVFEILRDDYVPKEDGQQQQSPEQAPEEAPGETPDEGGGTPDEDGGPGNQ